MRVHKSIKLPPELLAEVEAVATTERRAFNNMVEVLLVEALAARKRATEART